MLFSNWLFCGWILFHKNKIISKNEMYSTILPSEKKVSIIQPNITDGEDHRIMDKKEKEIPILLYIKKRNQLQLLEDPSISIMEKIEIINQIEKDVLYGYNIEKGGLWRDWN